MTDIKSKNLSEVYEFSNSQYSVVDSSQRELLTEEDQKVVDGKYIIGRVVGPMFVPDGASRNDRWYPKELWEKVINDPAVKTKLAERLVFGSIGHDDQPFTDEDLRKGLASHITTKLWIDETTGLGMGESLILGTPTGQILLTALKAGSKLHVSSRAFGEYVPGKYHENMPIVDPDTYQFHCFDWVIDPGFLQARPVLKEKLEKELSKNKIMDEKDIIIKEMIAGLKESNKNLAVKNEALIKENAKLRREFEVLSKKANEALGKYKTVLGDKTVVKEALETSGAKTVSSLLEGVTPDVKKLLDFCKGKKIKHETLKGIEELVGAKNESSLANAHRILKARFEAKEAKLEKAMKLIESYRAYGTLEELSAAQTILEKYTQIGSVPDIVRIMSLCQEKINNVIKTKANAVVESLAKSSGIEIERVSNLVKKVGITEAKSILAGLKAKAPVSEAKEEVKEVKKPVSESRNGAAIAENFFKRSMTGAFETKEASHTETSGASIAENFFKKTVKR